MIANWSGDVPFTVQPLAAPTAISGSGGGTPASGGIGVIKQNFWTFVVKQALSAPGKDANWQTVVLVGDLTNTGSTEQTFVADFVIQDTQGRQFEEDLTTEFALRDGYGAQSSAQIASGETRHVIQTFPAAAGYKAFTVIPNSLVGAWGGNLSFTLP